MCELEPLSASGSVRPYALRAPGTGPPAVVALDDPALGPAFGGVRRWRYPDEQAAARDAVGLARAMSAKCLLLDVPGGGGKVALPDPPAELREEAYRRIGRAVERLGGRFTTGPDVGTGARELAWMARETRFVTRPDASGPGELGAATARGVVAAIERVLVALHGDPDWGARELVVQGLGEVGARVARDLARRGARVFATDIDPARRAVAEASGVGWIEPGGELDRPCDVLVPCALGGLITPATIPRLRCRAIAGSANCILGADDLADALERRGILFLPDFASSGGALILGATFHIEGRRPSLVEVAERVGAAAERVLARARARGTTPQAAAAELVAIARAHRLSPDSPGSDR